jgi:hypothetical protein
LAVRKFGRACGCKTKLNAELGDVAFYLGSEPFMVFQIQPDKLDSKRIRKMLSSDALLRVVITFNEKRFFRYEPQKVREK